jgi:hypothetical protein
VVGVATIALIVVAWRGLDALKLTQDGLALTQRDLDLTQRDMSTRATRDARICAVQRCEEFGKKILPMRISVLIGMSRNKIHVFVQDPKSLTFDPDNTAIVEAAIAWWKAVPFDVQNDCISLLNALEAWAMYFTNALADEQIACGPCAPQYCSIVVQLYGYLLQVRTEQESGKFPNAIKLFRVWMPRLEEEKRGLVTGNLLKQLEILQAREIPQAALDRPLGT